MRHELLGASGAEWEVFELSGLMTQFEVSIWRGFMSYVSGNEVLSPFEFLKLHWFQKNQKILLQNT
jgi:hypothetical protein